MQDHARRRWIGFMSAVTLTVCGCAAGSSEPRDTGAAGTTLTGAAGDSGGAGTAGTAGDSSGAGTAGSGSAAGATGLGTAGTGAAGSGAAGSTAGTGGPAHDGGAGSSAPHDGGTPDSGGAVSGAGGTVGELGVSSCQPAFETACKPKIVFINDDPNGRGKVFTNVVPDVDTTMKDIACTACSMLYRDPSEMPKNERPTTITLHLQAYGGVAQTGNATIQFDLDYINGYANKSAAIAKQEMLGVLQHETVHIYQNYGNNGTGEGDESGSVRTRTGYYQRSRWVKGGSWKDPYTTSGFFYSWLTGPCAFHSENYPQHDLNLPYKLNTVLAGFAAKTRQLPRGGQPAHAAGVRRKNADTLWTQYQQPRSSAAHLCVRTSSSGRRAEVD